VTLTKVDDLLLSFPVRSRDDRPCVVLDPFGLAAGLQELVWDPVTGCVDSMEAERRAKAFTAGTIKGAVAGGYGMTPPGLCGRGGEGAAGALPRRRVDRTELGPSHSPQRWPRVFVIVATFQSDPNFGRILAAYGGVFVAGSLASGVIVDKFRPDRYDLIGAGDLPGRCRGHHVRAANLTGCRSSA
jgi:hypothetical protein